MLSIGVFFQKKVIEHNRNISLMVLIFYIFGVAFFANVFIYIFKFIGSRVLEDSSAITGERFDVFISVDFFVTLLNVMSIYKMLILTEMYRYIALIYINKKGQISKVTIFGALHGFFVVLIVLLFDVTTTFDQIFIATITFAYVILFISKYFETRKSKTSNVGKRVRFKRLFHGNETATQLLESGQVDFTINYFENSAGESSDKSDGGTVLSERVPDEWNVKHFRSSFKHTDALQLSTRKVGNRMTIHENGDNYDPQKNSINLTIMTDSQSDDKSEVSASLQR